MTGHLLHAPYKYDTQHDTLYRAWLLHNRWWVFWFGVSYPGYAGQYALLTVNKVNAQNNDAGNARTSPQSSRGGQEDNVSDIRDHLARWIRG